MSPKQQPQSFMILAANAHSMDKPQKIQPTLFSSLVQMSVIIWWTSHHPIKSYNYIVLNIYYVPVPLLTAPAALLHYILTPAL